MAVAREKVVAPSGQPINHFRPSHFLRTSPGIEITIPLQGEAMLLDPHVTHSHFFDELVHGHAFSALERVENFKPLRAADLREQSLVHGCYHNIAWTLHALIFKRQYLKSRKFRTQRRLYLLEWETDNFHRHRRMFRRRRFDSGSHRIKPAF